MPPSEEKENCLKVVEIIFGIVPKYLRELFVKRWNEKPENKEWGNDVDSGKALIAKIGPTIWESKKFDNVMKDRVKKGNVNEWDSSILFQVLQDCKLELIGDNPRQAGQRKPPLRVSEKIAILRDKRNYLCHIPKISIPTDKFKKIVDEIKGVVKEVFGSDAEKEIQVVEEPELETQKCTKLEEQLKQEQEKNREYERWLEKRVENLEDKVKDVRGRLSVLEREKSTLQKGHSGTNDSIEKIPEDVEKFVGRAEYLDQLKTAFKTKQFVILHGIVGVGKSGIVTRFAHENKDTYENRIWINMHEIYGKGNEVVFDEICRQILRKLNVDINEIKEDDPSVHLERRFRTMNNTERKTLIILDNLETFLEIPKEIEVAPIAKLFERAAKNAKSMLNILAASRVKADEEVFKTLKNIELRPLTEEEMNDYLNKFSEEQIKDNVDVLKSKCRGYPLVLKILTKMLCETDDKEQHQFILNTIQRQPEISEYLGNCLNSSLEILSENELKLAKDLSFFPGDFTWGCANKLSSHTGSDKLMLTKLISKGIITQSNPKEYNMHPFLKEIIKKKVNEDQAVVINSSLIYIYLQDLLELGKESFEKDKLSESVKAFLGRIWAFDHLISLLKLYSTNTECCSKVKEMMQKDKLEKQDRSLFYLLLRFLYYLGPKNEIRTIFKFLQDASIEEATKSMLTACLDELDWKISENQSLNSSDSREYEDVMYKRIQFSTSIQSIIEKQQQSTKNPVKPDTNESLPKRDELIKLLEKIEKLKDNAFRNYYIIEITKLLGKLSSFEEDFDETLKYYEKAANISRKSFGDSFSTIDCLQLLAEHLRISREKENNKHKAGEILKEALNMATRTGLINQTKIFTPRMNSLLLSHADFWLAIGDLKEEAKEPLQKIINGYFDYGDTGYLCKAIRKWCYNYKEYPENLEKLSPKFDDNYIKMVDEVLAVLINITDRCGEESEITKMAKIGKRFLDDAINAAGKRKADREEEKKSLEEALYRWNKDIALRCGHVILESERKKYATEAWNIAENKGYAKGMERKYLTMVKEANSSEGEEQMILKVTLLEKTYKIMKHKGKQAQQKERLKETLKSCQWDWPKLKLLVCLLKFDSEAPDDKINLMENASDIMSKISFVTLKQFDVLQRCVEDFVKRSLSEDEKKRLCCISQLCTKKLENIEEKVNKDLAESLKKKFDSFSKHFCDST